MTSSVRRFLPAAAALVVAAASCSDGSAPTPPGDDCAADLSSGVAEYALGDVLVRAVLPTSTNPCIVSNADSHFVAVAPGVASSGRLFVFLPGSGASARNYRRIVFEAARSGYAAVGLTYVNDVPVGVRCALAAAGCYAEVRREVISGTDASPRLTVSWDDGIEGRLVRLLQALERLDPTGGWQAFHTGTAPRWDRISVAGHSQGGGHSLFIAQSTDVFRATAYSSAGDLTPLVGTPVEWIEGSWATPADRRGGFTSERDEVVPYAGTVEAWTRSGLAAFGPPTAVDGADAPWGGARMLTTRADPRNPGAVATPHHSVTVVDAITPLDGDDRPTFAPVWRALSFPPP